MDRDGILNLVLNRLGNRQNDSVLREEAKLELTLAQESLELQPELPWFLESEWADTTIAVQKVAVPSDFLMEVEDSHLYLTKADGEEVMLTKDSFDALKGKYGNQDDAQPKTYALMRNYFFFFPAPDTSYSVRMQYYGKDVVLTDAVLENQWTRYASDWLLAELGVVLAQQYVRDDDAAKLFLAQSQRAMKRALDQTIARREANQSRSMGD